MARATALAFILLATLVVIVLPAAGVLHGIWSTPSGAPHAAGWALLARTLGFPLLIGVLATLLAAPAAWSLRSSGTRRGLFAPLALCPLLLPAYLAYAGLSLARSPGTWLGDWLERAHADFNTAYQVCIAVAGLALWSWPIAALTLSAAWRHIPIASLESMALDGAGPLRRCWHIARLSHRALAASVCLIALVMLGSAVPLHLSQIDTLAIHLWSRLSLEPAGAVWPSAWPLLLIALIAAWLITSALDHPPAEEANQQSPPRAGAFALIAATIVWLAAVALPIALFFWGLRNWSSLALFWQLAGRAVAQSGVTALLTGLSVALLAAAVWVARSCGAPRSPGMHLLRAAVLLIAITGLIPGVLVGSAVRQGWDLLALAPSMAPLTDALDRAGLTLLLAHIARFGFLGAFLGWWLAAQEPADLRSLRNIDGALTFRAWLRLCLPQHAAALAGIGLAAAALSLHEIESTIIVQPPGYRGLAQRVLEYLHYSRHEEMCAAAVNLMLATVSLALLAGWLLSRSRRATLPSWEESRSPAHPQRP